MSSLDLKGLKCPLPVLKTRHAMQSLKRGETLEVFATDPGILRDMPNYCERSGNTLLAQENRAEGYFFVLRKN